MEEEEGVLGCMEEEEAVVEVVVVASGVAVSDMPLASVAVVAAMLGGSYTDTRWQLHRTQGQT